MPIEVPGHRYALPDGDRPVVDSVESVVNLNGVPVSSWRPKRRPIAPTSSNSTLQQYTQPGDQIAGRAAQLSVAGPPPAPVPAGIQAQPRQLVHAAFWSLIENRLERPHQADRRLDHIRAVMKPSTKQRFSFSASQTTGTPKAHVHPA